MNQVTCGKCKNALQYPNELAGKKIRCPNCSSVLSLPASLPATSQPKSSGPAAQNPQTRQPQRPNPQTQKPAGAGGQAKPQSASRPNSQAGSNSFAQPLPSSSNNPYAKPLPTQTGQPQAAQPAQAQPTPVPTATPTSLAQNPLAANPQPVGQPLASPINPVQAAPQPIPAQPAAGVNPGIQPLAQPGVGQAGMGQPFPGQPAPQPMGMQPGLPNAQPMGQPMGQPLGQPMMGQPIPYQQPAYMQPQKRKRKGSGKGLKLGLIWGGVGAGVITLVILIVVFKPWELFGGGGPKSVFYKLKNAMLNEDFGALYDVMQNDQREQLDAMMDMATTMDNTGKLGELKGLTGRARFKKFIDISMRDQRQGASLKRRIEKEREDIQSAKVVKVEMSDDGMSATLTIDSKKKKGETMRVVKEDNGWKIGGRMGGFGF